MKAKLIHSGEQKTYALIFEKDDEVIAGLTSFAKQQSLGASHFTAIGAFSDVTLGYFNPRQKRLRQDTRERAGGSALCDGGYRLE